MFFLKKKRAFPAPVRALPGVLSLVMATAALSGCSSTGTMYDPQSAEFSEEGATEDAYAGATYTDAGEFTLAGSHSGDDAPDDSDHDESGPRGRRPEETPDRGEAGSEEAYSSEPVWLDGSGSDLFAADIVNDYYGFVLEGTSLQLPCSMKSLEKAGWELCLPESGSCVITPFSFEFFDAYPAGEVPASGSSTHVLKKGQKRVRLCLANLSDSPAEPSECMICGISADAASGVSLQTAFNTGIGDSLSVLTSVFGTDKSIYTVTSYSDGTKRVRYRFSNGITEQARIPVLAEAEDKEMSEMLLAQTAEDGDTIVSLSLYYFRIPNVTDPRPPVTDSDTYEDYEDYEDYADY